MTDNDITLLHPNLSEFITMRSIDDDTQKAALGFFMYGTAQMQSETVAKMVRWISLIDAYSADVLGTSVMTRLIDT